MAREDPQLKIRLPDVLKARIEEVAGKSGRSMNAEIVLRLIDSFEHPPPPAGPMDEAVFNRVFDATYARVFDETYKAVYKAIQDRQGDLNAQTGPVPADPPAEDKSPNKLGKLKS